LPGLRDGKGVDPGAGRPTWARVDLGRLRDNFRLIRWSAGVPVLAVVKAEAYGHGLIPVARALEGEEGLWGFGVATLGEALCLRRGGVEKPVLVLGWVPPQEGEEALSSRLSLTIFDRGEAEAWSRKARELGLKARVHLKVDTGMSRLGFTPGDDPLPLLHLPGLRVEGIYTHFATPEDPDFTREQLGRLLRWRERLGEKGKEILFHAAGTGSLFDYPEARLNLVRPGLGLYGYHPFGKERARELGLKPVLSWHTRISQVKELDPGTPVSYGGTYRTRGRERIAVLPVGYADGYRRFLSNRGRVLIRGLPAPVVGRVCMDQIMVGVTGVGAERGEEALLLGEGLTADDLAALGDTISYEILTGISPRVPRMYVGWEESNLRTR